MAGAKSLILHAPARIFTLLQFGLFCICFLENYMASQQGSRSALITWVVVLAIVSVTATIFAFYYSAAARKADTEFTDYKKRYSEVVADAALASPEIQALKDARKEENSGFAPNEKLLTVALTQRDHLVKAITGSSVPAGAVEVAVKTTLADSAKKLTDAKANVALPSAAENLDGAVQALANAVTEKQAQLADLQKQLLDAKASEAKAAERATEQMAAKDKQIGDIRTETSKQIADAQAARTNNQNVVAEIQKAVDTERQTAAANVQKLTSAVAERESQIKRLNKDLEAARQKFASKRLDVANPMITHASGHISRIGEGVVYIDLGEGQQLTPGMSFEVYDKSTGVPALIETQGEEQLPIGKASIEVVHVGPTASECRVLRTKAGASPITEGDDIKNLIYDPHTKYNFVIYGKFDLDQNGMATEKDTGIVKRLVTQWGGNLTDQINVDTDFVVLGKEPELPSFTKEEREDPINAKKLADAQTDLDAYQDVRNKARDLHIPVMNQNRFLYYIGYYEQAKR